MGEGYIDVWEKRTWEMKKAHLKSGISSLKDENIENPRSIVQTRVRIQGDQILEMRMSIQE